MVYPAAVLFLLGLFVLASSVEDATGELSMLQIVKGHAFHMASPALAREHTGWTPDGWVVNRSDPSSQAYFDVHIPKTAGCSFSKDVQKILRRGDGYWSQERCFSTTIPDMLPQDRQVLMLREPRSHVQSQFLECKYDPDWHKYNLSLAAWLSHFGDGNTTDNLGCYNPYNMQTRAMAAMTCDGNAPHNLQNNTFPYGEETMRNATANLNSMFFVGIVDHYQASLCLFYAKVRPDRPLPEWCNCEDKMSWASANLTHEAHGVPHHNVNDLSDGERAHIDRLTVFDQQLYSQALSDFVRDLREVEREHGIKILCSNVMPWAIR